MHFFFSFFCPLCGYPTTVSQLNIAADIFFGIINIQRHMRLHEQNADFKSSQSPTQKSCYTQH